MRVCKHSCDITQILIGYVLSDARFDWLVGNMGVYVMQTLDCARVCITVENSPNCAWHLDEAM